MDHDVTGMNPAHGLVAPTALEHLRAHMRHQLTVRAHADQIGRCEDRSLGKLPVPLSGAAHLTKDGTKKRAGSLDFMREKRTDLHKRAQMPRRSRVRNRKGRVQRQERER
jgi:hypothetical protein